MKMNDTADRAPPAARWLAAVAAFVLLNALLTLENDGPFLWPHFVLRLSFELCMVVLALTLWAAWRRPLGARAFALLAALTTIWVLSRYLDVTVSAVFGRPINLYWDGRHVWEVLNLGAGGTARWWQVGAGAIAIAALLALLYRVALACWLRLAPVLGRRAARPAITAVGVALLAVFALHGTGGRNTRWFFSMPVAPEITRQVKLLANQLSVERTAARLSPSPAFTGGVAGLRGADVLLVFAESYGVTTLDNPRQAAALAPHRARLAQALAASGLEVVSARLRSPTFAGASWLAHAAVLTGVDTHDPLDHDLLLATQRPTLVQHFRNHGYRTVSWMPGLHKPWPEGRFYGFDRYADLQSIGYAGPPLGYWRVPDQASMALLHAQELAAPRAGRAPRFIVFPTVTSHAPFRPVAPYVSDWERLTGPDAYSAAQIAQALDEPVSWQDPAPGYLQAIGYTHQWLGGYLSQRAPAGLLTIVMGDHQPLASVSGAGASWDVPVHVISADRALLDRFTAAGFQPGLLPPPPALGDMHAFTATLLRIADAAAAQ
jgi:hypothetical protein